MINNEEVIILKGPEEIEISVFKGYKNNGRLSKYVELEVPSITWLSPSQVKTLISKLKKSLLLIEKQDNLEAKRGT